MRKQQESSHLQAKERGLEGVQTCWYLNLGLLVSKTVRINFCCLRHLVCGILFGSPRKLVHMPRGRRTDYLSYLYFFYFPNQFPVSICYNFYIWTSWDIYWNLLCLPFSLPVSGYNSYLFVSLFGSSYVLQVQYFPFLSSINIMGIVPMLESFSFVT